ncbi:MAG TPA: hypothetical protein VG938_09060 [Verrucomicrobiae bacterium]|nr:hypothetical protein [Verrucomicrobiae bacterium]
MGIVRLGLREYREVFPAALAHLARAAAAIFARPAALIFRFGFAVKPGVSLNLSTSPPSLGLRPRRKGVNGNVILLFFFNRFDYFVSTAPGAINEQLAERKRAELTDDGFASAKI